MSSEASPIREPFPFYPVVVAAFPALSVYSANLAYVPAGQIIRPLLVVVGVTVLLATVFGLILKSRARGASAATALMLCTFGYGWYIDHTVSIYYLGSPILLWAIPTAILVGFAAWRLTATRVLNVLATAIALVALANLGLSLFRAQRLSSGRIRSSVGTTASNGPKPDVFYIILDGHGRTDAIRRAIGYDDSPFVDGLRRRGFYVADKSHSNYCQTELSLASSLNMDTVQRLLPKAKPDEKERKPLAEIIDDNEVARRLRAKGYRFLAVTSGFPPVSFNSANLQLGTRWGGSMIETTLLQMTPFAHSNVLESQFVARRQNLLGAFDNLASLATPTVSPRFVVAHILAPHPPFVFGPNGEELPHHGAFGFWDGDDYMTFVGTHEEYRRGYAGQVEWVEKQALAAIDRLIAGATPGRPPIIVVQGDHGSKLHLAQNSLDETDLHECFPILNAYLVPEAVRKDLRPGITPVNSFRLVLHDLFGDDLPPLPDKSWYSRYATPYAFTEVTDRIEPVSGAPAPLP